MVGRRQFPGIDCDRPGESCSPSSSLIVVVPFDAAAATIVAHMASGTPSGRWKICSWLLAWITRRPCCPARPTTSHASPDPTGLKRGPDGSAAAEGGAVTVGGGALAGVTLVQALVATSEAIARLARLTIDRWVDGIVGSSVYSPYTDATSSVPGSGKRFGDP